MGEGLTAKRETCTWKDAIFSLQELQWKVQVEAQKTQWMPLSHLEIIRLDSGFPFVPDIFSSSLHSYK